MVWYSGFGILGSPAKPYHPFNTKWPTGSENRSDLRLLNSNQLLLNKFIDHSFYKNLKNSKWPPGSGKWSTPLYLDNIFTHMLLLYLAFVITTANHSTAYNLITTHHRDRKLFVCGVWNIELPFSFTLNRFCTFGISCGILVCHL